MKKREISDDGALHNVLFYVYERHNVLHNVFLLHGGKLDAEQHNERLDVVQGVLRGNEKNSFYAVCEQLDELRGSEKNNFYEACEQLDELRGNEKNSFCEEHEQLDVVQDVLRDNENE